ncbi:MAG TPA: sugar ABC transporter substrate-binding protein [Candidatus Aerophobetes bacterium]|uniref:Sugar ABC transporter substrate-binding protein n=1 Tax=Aerophobetes bacterium TaxID=2030807 RepID=A0A7V0QSE1_UNCAE|nr:sugar ABC transporter substrate-binding protein [Candidatus Aerophobetes bacterium]
MRIKKIIKLMSVGMLVVIILGFVGVFPVFSKSSEVTVLLQMRSGPEATAMEPVVDYWNKHYAASTGIRVRQVTISRMGYYVKLFNQLVSGTQVPDIVFPFGFGIGKIIEYLEPLNSFIEDESLFSSPQGNRYDIKDMFPAMLESVTLNGKIYMLATDVSAPLLYYRTDLIKTPPQTWDEFIEMAKKFTKSYNPDSPTEYGTVWMAKPVLDDTLCWLEIFWAYGGSFFKEGSYEPNFNSPAGIKATEFLKKLSDSKVIPPDVVTYEYPEVLAALQTGKVAFAIEWNAAYPDLTNPKKSPKVYDKIAITNPPGVKQADGSIKRVVETHCLGLSINKNSQYKREAFKFMSWVTFGEGAKIYLDNGGIPPLFSLFTAPEAKSPLPEMAEAVGKYGRAIPVFKDQMTVIFMNTKHLNKVFIGEETPEEAMENFNNEVYELFKERGYFEEK